MWICSIFVAIFLCLDFLALICMLACCVLLLSTFFYLLMASDRLRHYDAFQKHIKLAYNTTCHNQDCTTLNCADITLLLSPTCCQFFLAAKLFWSPLSNCGTLETILFVFFTKSCVWPRSDVVILDAIMYLFTTHFSKPCSGLS